MRITKRTHQLAAAAGAAAAMAAALTLAAPAHGDPFDRRRVPADAKWVVHVDVDAARGTPLMAAAQSKLAADPGVKDGLYQVTAATGAHVPDDVHDLTLYGRARGDEAVVVVIHAKVDRAQTMATARRATDFTLHTVGGHEVAGWTDKGQAMFGGFHDDATLVVAHTEANVVAALDLLDGHGQAEPADGPLVGTTPATTRPVAAAADKPILYLAVTDLPSLAGPDNPLPGPLQQVRGASLSIAEVGPSTVVRVNLTAATADAAEQLKTAGEGLRAMLQFAAAGDADARTKMAAGLVKSVVLGQSGPTVTADVSVPTGPIIKDIEDGAVHADVKIEVDAGASHQHAPDDK